MRKSFTFLEVILVIVLIGIFSTGFSWYFVKIIDSWQYVSLRSENMRKARLALFKISRQLRQIVPSGIESIGENEIQFLMTQADINMRVRYSEVSNQVHYQIDNNIDGVWEVDDILVDNADITFNYYDQDGQQTDVLSEIKLIKIELKVGNGVKMVNLSLKVYPRNLL